MAKPRHGLRTRLQRAELLTSLFSPPFRPKTGGKSPDHADDQTAGVGIVGDVLYPIQPTGKEPNEHYQDRLRMKKKARGRIEFALHPDIPEQSVNDAGHAEEGWTAKIPLGKVR